MSKLLCSCNSITTLASVVITKLVKLLIAKLACTLGYKKVKITAVYTCVHC